MYCKSGQRALIVSVNDPRFTQNIGKIVQIVHETPHPYSAEAAWLVECLSSPMVVKGPEMASFRRMERGVVLDKNLRPLPDENTIDVVMVTVKKHRGWHA